MGVVDEKQNGLELNNSSPFNLARPAGFEPTTPWFVAKYSNPTELRAHKHHIKEIHYEYWRARQDLKPRPLGS